MKNLSPKTNKLLRKLPAVLAWLVLAVLLCDAWRRQLPLKAVGIALLAWTICVTGVLLIVLAVTESLKKYRVKNPKK